MFSHLNIAALRQTWSQVCKVSTTLLMPFNILSLMICPTMLRCLQVVNSHSFIIDILSARLRHWVLCADTHFHFQRLPSSLKVLNVGSEVRINSMPDSMIVVVIPSPSDWALWYVYWISANAYFTRSRQWHQNHILQALHTECKMGNMAVNENSNCHDTMT